MHLQKFHGSHLAFVLLIVGQYCTYTSQVSGQCCPCTSWVSVWHFTYTSCVPFEHLKYCQHDKGTPMFIFSVANWFFSTCFKSKILLCSPSWPWTHKDPPALTLFMLGLWIHITMLSLLKFKLSYWWVTLDSTDNIILQMFIPHGKLQMCLLQNYFPVKWNTILSAFIRF